MWVQIEAHFSFAGACQAVVLSGSMDSETLFRTRSSKSHGSRSPTLFNAFPSQSDVVNLCESQKRGYDSRLQCEDYVKVFYELEHSDIVLTRTLNFNKAAHDHNEEG